MFSTAMSDHEYSLCVGFRTTWGCWVKGAGGKKLSGGAGRKPTSVPLGLLVFTFWPITFHLKENKNY